jgi:hypothetical protein
MHRCPNCGSTDVRGFYAEGVLDLTCRKCGLENETGDRWYVPDEVVTTTERWSHAKREWNVLGLAVKVADALAGEFPEPVRKEVVVASDIEEHGDGTYDERRVVLHHTTASGAIRLIEIEDRSHDAAGPSVFDVHIVAQSEGLPVDASLVIDARFGFGDKYAIVTATLRGTDAGLTKAIEILETALGPADG